VTAVGRSAKHTLNKPNQDGIRLIAGSGCVSNSVFNGRIACVSAWAACQAT
jgi:hypothetical protein